MFTIKIHPKLFFLFLFTITFSLQGCGSERDTPFNPTTSSSSSSSLGTSIEGEFNILDELNNESERNEPTANLASTTKRLVAIRNFDQMDSYWDEYINDLDWAGEEKIDFEKGQVLLIDLGELGDCSNLTTIQNVNAYDHSPNTVKVVIKYRDAGRTGSSSSRSSASSASSSSAEASSSSAYSEPSCDVDPSEPNQPFRFYFIPSRKVMVFQEDIE